MNLYDELEKIRSAIGADTMNMLVDGRDRLLVGCVKNGQPVRKMVPAVDVTRSRVPLDRMLAILFEGAWS
jgi:hypothetical protein